ncbi:MAG: glycosyltransferase [Pseudomonadota bacterium]
MKSSVSVVVPVYRHQPYLEAALESILALEYDDLEIIIQDDASPDDAFEVVQRVVAAYNGPHAVKIGRNDKNLSMGNFNVLMERASGEYIICAHDDDIQYPQRVAMIMDIYRKHDVSMVTSNAIKMTAEGDLIGPVSKTGDRLILAEEFAEKGWSNHMHGPVLTWHRDVFDKFKPIDVDGTARASDWVIPYRASLLKGIYYTKEPTLLLRQHANSRGSIGRNTDDEDVFAVENCSESVTQMVYALKTTQEAQAVGIIDDERAGKLDKLIRDYIVEKCRLIAVSRNRLHMRKMRMTWIGHAAGAVVESDFPNLGVAERTADIFTNEGMMKSLPKRLSHRHKIVRAVKGRPWYLVALRNPFNVRYWWTLRKLQKELLRPGGLDA